MGIAWEAHYAGGQGVSRARARQVAPITPWAALGELSMSAPWRTTIPAFLGIDVEPTGFQIATGSASHWGGYAAAQVFAESLRDALARGTGAAPRFGWYLRMDPQIEQVFGRADAVADAVSSHVASARDRGDYFGVHMHPLRWSDLHAGWVHDFRDGYWLRECTHGALDAFERWNGAPTELFRAGAGFLNEDVVDVLEERGVRLEVSFEPMHGWKQRSATVGSGVDSTPIVGAYLDCRRAPTSPYRPSRGDFRRRGGAQPRSLCLVPMSSGPYAIAKPDWWSRSKRLVRRYCRPLHRHIYSPLDPWPNPRYFWDLVAHRLATMPRPYLSLAIRTDAGDSVPAMRYRAIFSALLQHPLAHVLRFVDPREALPQLVDEPATTAPALPRSVPHERPRPTLSARRAAASARNARG